jgi:hypothetical protein
MGGQPVTCYAYSNNGFSYRAVDDGYTAAPGEVLFNSEPDAAALDQAFPGYGTTVLNEAIATRCSLIDAERDRRLKDGVLFAGLHVALMDKRGTDGPRADLAGMATHAGFVVIGIPGVVWPTSYQQGWISVENDRIPLATAADGLALAQVCGAWFASVVQCARDKKDSCLLAVDQAALDAVSIGDGWPANTDPVA